MKPRKAMPWLVYFSLAVAVAGIPYSYAQVPDPFTMQQMGRPGPEPKGPAGASIDCNGEFQKHNAEMQKRGIALGEASKRKANVKDACALLRNYTNAENNMIKFLRAHSGGCGIPPDILKQLLAGNTKSTAMRDQVCKAATQQQAAPPPPPPSQGLSGVLGSGGPGSGSASGGTGVFESLTGNVLKQ